MKYSKTLYNIGKGLSWSAAKLYGRMTVHGREHIPRTGGVLLAANHASYMDPPVLGSACPRLVHFMAKSELFEVPVLGGMIARVGAFPVKRGAADRQALRTAHELLTANEVVAIFYEGGRSPDGVLLPPTLGPALVALRAGVPIVPAALINTDKLLPPKGKGLRFTQVTVAFGAPLTFPEYAGKADREALTAVSRAVACAVADLLRAHGAADRVPEGYPDNATGETPAEGE